MVIQTKIPSRNWSQLRHRFLNRSAGNIIAISDGETITWNNVPSNGEVLYAADFVSVKKNRMTRAALVSLDWQSDTGIKPK